MAPPRNAIYVSLQPGQKEEIAAWRVEKRFCISAFVQDCISILEERPELLDTARPGAELAARLRQI